MKTCTPHSKKWSLVILKCTLSIRIWDWMSRTSRRVPTHSNKVSLKHRNTSLPATSLNTWSSSRESTSQSTWRNQILITLTWTASSLSLTLRISSKWEQTWMHSSSWGKSLKRTTPWCWRWQIQLEVQQESTPWLIIWSIYGRVNCAKSDSRLLSMSQSSPVSCLRSSWPQPSSF